MIDSVVSIIGYIPFEWASFTFMQYAFFGLLFLAPLLALLGTLVADHRLAFFSDSLGHVSMTGVALAVLVGASSSFPVMLLFSLIFTYLIFLLKKLTSIKIDSVISMMTSFCVALGIAVISSSGTLSKFNAILFGNILALNSNDLLSIFVVSLIFYPVYYIVYRGFILLQLGETLARSRGAPVILIELIVMTMLAVVVTFAVSWVGLLVMNALLILPAVTSKLLSKSLFSFQLIALIVGIFTALTGLVVSFYVNASTGATIVLVQMALFVLVMVVRKTVIR